MSTTIDAPASPLIAGDVAAGRYLKKSERFVRDEVRAGRLKMFKFGNRRMYHVDDLDEYIARARREAEEAKDKRRKRRTPAGVA